MKKIIKKYNKVIALTNFIIFLPLIFGLIMWKELPEKLPLHYNIYGEVDSYSSKLFALLFGPIFSFVMYWIIMILIAFEVKADKKEKNLLNNRVIMILLLFLMPCMSLHVGFLIYGKALGIVVNPHSISLVLIGGIFLLSGNYLPKSRPNNIFGVRLPWTLESTDNWIKTNRFAGILMLILGIVMVVDAFILVGGGPGANILILCGCIFLVISVSVYSFINRKKYI